jgi:hypothetical protein
VKIVRQNLFRKRPVIIFTLLVLIGAASILRADEILLREGKTLHGKITHEDANEVMIRTAPTMYLRIERSKIQKITRAAPTGPTNVVRTVNTPAVKKSTASVTVSTTTTKAPAIVEKSTATPAAPKGEKATTTKAVAVATRPGVTFAETISVKPVSKPTLDFSWAGVSDKEGANFKWKSLVLTSTISVMMPTSTEKQNQARLDIYHTSIESLSQALQSLRVEGDAKLKETSQILVDSALARAEIRQRGYSRHLVEEKNKIKKKN